MTRNAIALTILAAAGLSAQKVDPAEAEAISNRRAAETKRRQYLRIAHNFDQSYQECGRLEQSKKRPNPHACEHYRRKATARSPPPSRWLRRRTAGNRCIPTMIRRAPRIGSTRWDSARRSRRKMIPSPGQVVQGAWHGLQNKDTAFQTDPNLLPEQPAVDYRYTMGGNAGAQNGQSTFGSNVGGGGFQVPRRGLQTPRYVPNRRPVQQRPRYQPRVRQGHYRNGRLVDD